MKVTKNVKVENDFVEVVKGFFLHIWGVSFTDSDFDIHERACPYTPGVEIEICQSDGDEGGIYIEGTFYDGGAEPYFSWRWPSCPEVLTQQEIERENILCDFFESARGLAFLRAAVEEASN